MAPRGQGSVITLLNTPLYTSLLISLLLIWGCWEPCLLPVSWIKLDCETARGEPRALVCASVRMISFPSSRRHLVPHSWISNKQVQGPRDPVLCPQGGQCWEREKTGGDRRSMALFTTVMVCVLSTGKAQINYIFQIPNGRDGWITIIKWEEWYYGDLVAVCPWVCYLTSLCLSSLINELETIIPYDSLTVVMKLKKN